MLSTNHHTLTVARASDLNGNTCGEQLARNHLAARAMEIVGATYSKRSNIVPGVPRKRESDDGVNAPLAAGIAAHSGSTVREGGRSRPGHTLEATSGSGGTASSL